MNTIKLQSLISTGAPAVQVMPSHHRSSGHHDHDFYELVYVTEGYCLHHVNGLSTLLMEGDCFILPPGVVHAYSGNRVTRIYNCVFDRSVVEEYLPRLQKLPGLDSLFDGAARHSFLRLHLDLSQRKFFLRRIAFMEELCQKKPVGWELQLPAELICLLTEYSRVCSTLGEGVTGENFYPSYVRQAFPIIDAEYANCDLTVHRIATLVGVSDDHLTRQFKQVTGITTQEYLRRYRFARAMDLLQAGCPVAQAAQQSGFRTLSYFSREFTKELGISPSKYKNQSNHI